MSNITPRIAFLGIGLMGQPMVLRLLKAGFNVTVWNRTEHKTQICVDAGARHASSPKLAVQDANIVISMLENGAIVGEVLAQILPALQPQPIFCDMSSTRQSEAIAFNDLLANHAIHFVDAPVSGGVLGAQAGTLAIMAGAEPAIFDVLQPIITAMGKPTRVGLAGSGQLAKLCNQLIVGGTLHLVAEALLLAQAGGANPAAVRQALRGGFAESRILEVHGQRMLERNFMPGGQVKSQAKDMDNILDAAAGFNLQLPQAQLIQAVYARLLEHCPNADQSAALLDLEKANAGCRLGEMANILPS